MEIEKSVYRDMQVDLTILAQVCGVPVLAFNPECAHVSGRS